jgi:hypothetical protein
MGMGMGYDDRLYTENYSITARIPEYLIGGTVS